MIGNKHFLMMLEMIFGPRKCDRRPDVRNPYSEFAGGRAVDPPTAPGTERAGLVASSSAQRLKPHAIDIRVNIDPVH